MQHNEFSVELLRKRTEALDRGMTAKGLNAQTLATLLEHNPADADMLAVEIAEARAGGDSDLLRDDSFCERVAGHLGISPSAFGLHDPVPELLAPPAPPKPAVMKRKYTRRQQPPPPPQSVAAAREDRTELDCTPEEIAELFQEAVVIAFCSEEHGRKEFFLRAERQISDGDLVSLLLRKLHRPEP